MDGFKIVILEDDVFISTKYSSIIDTHFYIRVNDCCFPDELWTDFSYPVVCMWAEELLRNRRRKKAHYSLPLMDGPFRIEVTQENNKLLLEGINARGDEQTVFSFSCPVQDFLCELLRALNKIKKIVADNEDTLGADNKESITDSVSHYIERIEGQCGL